MTSSGHGVVAEVYAEQDRPSKGLNNYFNSRGATDKDGRWVGETGINDRNGSAQGAVNALW